MMPLITNETMRPHSRVLFDLWLLFRTVGSRALWLGAAVAAVFGGIEAVSGLYLASGAPQQAAAAGMGCVYAIVPYVLARAFDEITRPQL